MNTTALMAHYDSLSIKKLPETISKNGFEYKLIKRTNEKLLYAQYSKSGSLIGYELFLNKLLDQHKAKQHWAKLRNQDLNLNDYDKYMEVFPKDEDFGARAWNYKSLDQALLAFDKK